MAERIWDDDPELAAAAAAERRKMNGQAPHLPLEVFDAGDIEIAKIPPRKHLLGTTFCRKFLSGLISEGGTGKTAIRYVQYLSAASGHELSGEYVYVRCRVLIVCLEDDLDEVRRRIAAAILHHQVTPAEIKGWLFYCTPHGLKLLQTDPRGIRTIGQLDTELRAIIRERRIDLVGIDPFIKAHGVEENDNNAIDEVCNMLAAIADEFDIAIDLVSHARKGSATPGDADRDRGASSKRDAGRLMRTATGMTVSEAATFKVDEKDRPSLVRVDDAKVNLTPKSHQAVWFKLVGCAIGKTNVDPLYPSGDNVQTVIRWYPPDVLPISRRPKSMPS
jgi:RecA-family ATPase